MSFVTQNRIIAFAKERNVFKQHLHHRVERPVLRLAGRVLDGDFILEDLAG